MGPDGVPNAGCEEPGDPAGSVPGPAGARSGNPPPSPRRDGNESAAGREASADESEDLAVCCIQLFCAGPAVNPLCPVEPVDVSGRSERLAPGTRTGWSPKAEKERPRPPSSGAVAPGVRVGSPLAVVLGAAKLDGVSAGEPPKEEPGGLAAGVRVGRPEAPNGDGACSPAPCGAAGGEKEAAGGGKDAAESEPEGAQAGCAPDDGAGVDPYGGGGVPGCPLEGETVP
ncbi:hypothetical protein Aco03nite_071560 [Actinoplanes couchii]|uniref:Uncharacterized protein n=1 Tax=Actinoplanes couchii TaxID=403638 RepID=A0ABQ3XJS2_9ACTN|nr:hypothetical protein Aco03nite_071560 [Actinoplanes couchii]